MYGGLLGYKLFCDKTRNNKKVNFLIYLYKKAIYLYIIYLFLAA